MANTNSRTKKRLKTLATKRDTRQETVLKELERCPIIQVACARANIGRSTYYEWIQKDKEFAKLATHAIIIGNEIFTDLAESKLMEGIKNGNMTGIIFRLKNFHPRYAEKRQYDSIGPPETEVTEKERKQINHALYNIGLGEIIKMTKQEREEILEEREERQRQYGKGVETNLDEKTPNEQVKKEKPVAQEPKKELVRKDKSGVRISDIFKKPSKSS